MESINIGPGVNLGKVDNNDRNFLVLCYLSSHITDDTLTHLKATLMISQIDFTNELFYDILDENKSQSIGGYSAIGCILTNNPDKNTHKLISDLILMGHTPTIKDIPLLKYRIYKTFSDKIKANIICFLQSGVLKEIKRIICDMLILTALRDYDPCLFTSFDKITTAY